jgi:diacylglycerol kinase
MSFFSFKLLLTSFRHAGKGLVKAIKREQNLRIHFLIAIFVLLLAFYLKVNQLELIIIIILITLIFVLELFNSIFERLVDLLQPRIHHYAKEIKDINAAIVLVAAIGSAVVGLIIFLPKILSSF